MKKKGIGLIKHFFDNLGPKGKTIFVLVVLTVGTVIGLSKNGGIFNTGNYIQNTGNTNSNININAK